MILSHELVRSGRSFKSDFPPTGKPNVVSDVVVPIPVGANEFQTDADHRTQSHGLAPSSCLLRESNATSSREMSQITHPSIRTGFGIRPSATSWSNFVGLM